MSEKWTKEELADKVEWEGGVYDAVCLYGLKPEYLPDDTPPEVVEAWTALYNSDPIKIINNWLFG